MNEIEELLKRLFDWGHPDPARFKSTKHGWLTLGEAFDKLFDNQERIMATVDELTQALLDQDTKITALETQGTSDTTLLNQIVEMLVQIKTNPPTGTILPADLDAVLAHIQANSGRVDTVTTELKTADDAATTATAAPPADGGTPAPTDGNPPAQ